MKDVLLITPSGKTLTIRGEDHLADTLQITEEAFDKAVAAMETPLSASMGCGDRLNCKSKLLHKHLWGHP